MKYTLTNHMEWHKPAIQTFGHGRHQAVVLTCECGDLNVTRHMPKGKAMPHLNVSYQDHLVDVVEARTR